MGNVLRVFWRDVKRIAKVPQAWSVVLFLMVLPSLYTWFNVAAFWGPYDNTGNLRVCVVNEDRGAHDDMLGDLDLGNQIVDQLEDNDQLDWVFVTREEAMDSVRSGDAYAAFVIPESFSEDVTTIVTSDFKQPTLEYYVNEKIGPVAPKITDTGANSLDTTINENFIAAVSSAVASSVDERLDDAVLGVENARGSVYEQLDEVGRTIGDARETLEGLSSDAEAAQTKVANAKATLAEAQLKLDSLSQDVETVSGLVGEANSGIVSFSTKAGSALDEGTADASRVSAAVSQAVSNSMNEVLGAKGAIDEAIGASREFSHDYSEVVSLLERLRSEMPDGALDDAAQAKIDDAIARLKESSEGASGASEELAAIASKLDQAARDMKESSSGVDSTVQSVLDGAEAYRSSLSSDTVPALSSSLSTIATAFGTLKSAIASQSLIMGEAQGALDQLDTTLQLTSQALGDTVGAIASAETEFKALRTDIEALGSASELRELLQDGSIDPAKISEFMMSPTTVKTEKLYPLNAYGSAMAPLFINLTLWIGVFMLMVIIRNDVDDEGVERLTLTQRFFGRGMLLTIIAGAQAIICCTGCLAMGVQCSSVSAFYLTAVVASLSYLAIQYTLSATFQHLGKAICVVLVFVQIPAATGLYPIEMTPEFFRIIYPLFPFTYGINAIRETIGGFYGHAWAFNIGMLLLFLAIFLVIAVAIRPSLTNMNRMFARQVEESDMVIGEVSTLPARRYRYTQVLRALSDREEYRREINVRAERFMQVYPTIKQYTVFISLLVPIFATAVMSILGVDKVIILTTWLGWFLLAVVFAVGIDYLRDNLIHQLTLDDMTDDEVRTLYSARQSYTRVKEVHDKWSDSARQETVRRGEADE
ncbi:MAG: YhgE/Pip domain-containing protein [Eggerthellaceae bacterium]|nr:YhgE/Pip domain-containing protein [Eggerthellaceae bacterium]